MESLGYIISDEFILIAVDKNIDTKFGSMAIKMKQAKKVYKLNDNTVISVIGLPEKTSHIYKYMKKLKELGHNQTFDDVIINLKDAFPKADVEEKKREVKKLFTDLKNCVITQEQLREKLLKRNDLMVFVDEIMRSSAVGIRIPTAIVVAHRCPVKKASVLVRYEVAGYNIVKQDVYFQQNIGQYNFGFNSSTKHLDDFRTEIESLRDEIQPLFITEFYNDKEQINTIISKGKEVLAKGLKLITPYAEEPNVVFYELSPRTNYIFEEPNMTLTEIYIS